MDGVPRPVLLRCVENGSIALPYGSDDATRLLHYLLRTSQFPYQSCALASVHDFLALEAIKERYCTCVEAEVNVVAAEFAVRRQGRPTLQYPFKMFDHIIKAPLVRGGLHCDPPKRASSSQGT